MLYVCTYVCTRYMPTHWIEDAFGTVLQSNAVEGWEHTYSSPTTVPFPRAERLCFGLTLTMKLDSLLVPHMSIS